MTGKLTARRLNILRRAVELERELERNVNTGDLVLALGITKQTLSEHLSVLQELGLLTRRGGRYGLIQLTQEGRAQLGEPLGLRILGCIAAGKPRSAEQTAGDPSVDRLQDLLRLADDDYLLRVEGESMIGAGIHPGDLVAVHRTTEILDGEIVVVLVPDENCATLKRVYRDGEHVRLESDHPDLPAMTYHASEVEIQGRYAGHIALRRPRRSARH